MTEMDKPPRADNTPSEPENYFGQHWRGDLPLWLSFWINWILVVPILWYCWFIVFQAFNHVPTGPYTDLGLLVCYWAVTYMIMTWQFVGIWRAAGKYEMSRVEGGRTGMWGGVARITIIVAFIATAADLVKSGIPQLTDAVNVGFRDDPEIPPFSVRVMRRGTEIEISGGIKRGLNGKLLEVFATNPQARVVHLNSEGGRTQEAVKVYKTIKSRDLTTYVSRRCLSACTMIFLAGKARLKLQRAKLGFHGSYSPGIEPSIFDHDEGLEDFYRSVGVDAAFAHRAAWYWNYEMWVPDDDVLKKSNVITGIVEDDRFAASGRGGELGFEAFAKFLKKENADLEDFETTQREKYNAIVKSYRDGYMSGKTKSELTKALAALLGRNLVFP